MCIRDSLNLVEVGKAVQRREHHLRRALHTAAVAGSHAVEPAHAAGEMCIRDRIEIKRSDYTVITFDIYESGKNGHVVTENYKYRLTFSGLLYHLCI